MNGQPHLPAAGGAGPDLRRSQVPLSLEAFNTVVREGGLCAFLDARPVFKGHVLIIPELHVHVVPRNPKDGLRGFFWPRTKYPSDEAAVEVAKSIRNLLSST